MGVGALLKTALVPAAVRLQNAVLGPLWPESPAAADRPEARGSELHTKVFSQLSPPVHISGHRCAYSFPTHTQKWNPLVEFSDFSAH